MPAGKTSNARICSIDFLPTFAALSGAPLPEPVDGIDVTSALEGEAAPSRNALYWHYPHYHNEKPGGAMLRGDWKLIEWFETGRTGLFNLADDPGAQKDLAAEHPAKAAELLAGLDAWRKDVGAQMPTPNPDYDPARADKDPPKAKKPRPEKPPKAARTKDHNAGTTKHAGGDDT